MTKSAAFAVPADLLPGVIRAAIEAGALIRAEFHREGGPRGDGSHAVVDGEVEALLKERLRSIHACRWNGEETHQDPIEAGDAWVVDPQDGTSDFMKGRRGSAISIALLRHRVPVLGVVFAPVAPDDEGDLIAWAEGADLMRNGVPVVVNVPRAPSILALNADAADYAAHNHGALSGFRIRALPSPAYRLALAAVGEVDAAVSLTRGLAPWDVAGGHALLIGAGRTAVDLRGRQIDYRRAFFDGIIGGSTDVVGKVLAAAPSAGIRLPRVPASPSMRTPLSDRLSRAQGCLLGQLTGDALGSAVEFQTEARIARGHPNGVTQLTDGGTWNLIAGQPTDDSEMALALARSLVKESGFNARAVSAAYVGWRQSGPFDIGGTTASGIESLAAGRIASSDGQSNGALMRVSPIGVFAAGDPTLAARLASEDARLTHPHPVCRAASAAYAAAIAVGIAGAREEEMWAVAHAHAGSDFGGEEVRRRLLDARRIGPSDYQGQMGWVLTALQNAFHCLMSGTSFADAVCTTVARGGDTDTNAAICGALIGARQGRDAVPPQWRNMVLTCRPVALPGVHRPRPATYWPDDALDLAEALLSAGRPQGLRGSD